MQTRSLQLRVSLRWITAYTLCHYTDTMRLHWLTGDTRSHCTVLQVMHNYIVLIYRWYTITLHWLTSIHCYTALTYRYTRSHCTDLRLIQDFYALPYRCYMITLHWLTSETQSHCNYLQVIHYYSGMTSQWLTSYSQYHWLTGYTRSHWFTGYTRFHLHTGYTRTDLQPINDPTDLQAKHARTYRLGCRWSVEYQEWLMW